jgi:hypothetical protein
MAQCCAAGAAGPAPAVLPLVGCAGPPRHCCCLPQGHPHQPHHQHLLLRLGVLAVPWQLPVAPSWRHGPCVAAPCAGPSSGSGPPPGCHHRRGSGPRGWSLGGGWLVGGVGEGMAGCANENRREKVRLGCREVWFHSRCLGWVFGNHDLHRCCSDGAILPAAAAASWTSCCRCTVHFTQHC